MEVSQIKSALDVSFSFPVGFSFFEPYIKFHVKEILEIGGEAYLSRNSDGTVTGIFIYDYAEESGTIFTRSREAFDYFYRLKPFNSLFSELKTDFDNEIYDIYTLDIQHLELAHRFSYEISAAEDEDLDKIEQFMSLTHPKINKKWVRVALKNGEKCFVVKLGSEIAGVGWVSLVNRVGRLHSLFVRSQFRRKGMGEDILNARLLWLKTKHAQSAFAEISRLNIASSNNVTKAHMKVFGQVFQYFKPELNKKLETKGGDRN